MNRLALLLTVALMAGAPASAITVKYDSKLPPKASSSLAPTSIEAIPALTAKGYAPEFAHHTTIEQAYARNVWNAPNSKVDPTDSSALFSYIRRGTAVFDLGEDYGAVAFTVGTPGATNLFTFYDDGTEIFRLTGDQIASGAGVTSIYSVSVQITDIVFDTLRISGLGGGPSVEFANLYASDRNPRRFTNTTGAAALAIAPAAAVASVAAVPAPGAAGLLAAALGVLGWRSRQRA